VIDNKSQSIIASKIKQGIGGAPLEMDLQRFASKTRYEKSIGNLVKDNFDDLAQLRKDLGLPEAGSTLDKSTLAKLQIGDESIYGINGHGQKVTLKANAISKTHAEGDVFQQAYNKGINADNATLYVDRDFCRACGINGGVKSMAKQLGISELHVYTPSGYTKIITK
jgi:hypothetical protein